VSRDQPVPGFLLERVWEGSGSRKPGLHARYKSKVSISTENVSEENVAYILGQVMYLKMYQKFSFMNILKVLRSVYS
jgi:hypothetical protein